MLHKTYVLRVIKMLHSLNYCLLKCICSFSYTVFANFMMKHCSRKGIRTLCSCWCCIWQLLRDESLEVSLGLDVLTL